MLANPERIACAFWLSRKKFFGPLHHLEWYGAALDRCYNPETDLLFSGFRVHGGTIVVPGQQMRYDFSDICNLSNVPLENFYWHDELPSSVRLTTIHTGTWSQPGLTYSVTYRTNRNSAYRTLASGLLSTQSYDLDCTPSKLGLAADEFITDFRFEFGTVQPGFREQDKPMILVTVNQGLANGHRFANRTDAGGQYNGKWFSSSFTWVTEVYAPVLEYPKTGY